MSDTALAPLYIYSRRVYAFGLAEWVQECPVQREDVDFILSVYREVEKGVLFIADTETPAPTWAY